MQVLSQTSGVRQWGLVAGNGRAVVCLAVAAALVGVAPLLAASSWRSGPDFHTVLEVAATLLALFVAAIAFVRYYTRPTSTILVIATAFLGTALLDGYHAVVTASLSSGPLLSPEDPLIPWSWLASRMFLSGFLWTSYLVWRRRERRGAPDWSPRAIYATAAALTLLSFMFFAFARLPPAYFPELRTPRPQDLIPAVFFALALAGYAQKGSWRRDPFEAGLLFSLTVSVCAQAAYMAWAAANYDSLFDAAHALKLVSYVAVAGALLVEAYFIYRSEQESAAKIRRVNAELNREIIERRRAETEREELEQQLRQAQKLEAVGQLAGGIAHDFNNVLTAIAGYVQLTVRRLDDSDPIKPDLDSVLDCTERGAKLVKQLVAFSRGQTLRSEVINLNPLLENAHGMVERFISAEIELEIETMPRIGNVEADANQIEQVLLNLVVNARDAMPRGGTLRLSTDTVELDPATAGRLGAAPGTYAVLAVSDTGAGMDEATLERIFDPFFTTKDVGKGSGLGLATAYGIVKQHRGAIGVESALNEGTTFRVYLPCVDGRPSAAAASAAESQPDVGGPETILLVEDEDMVREVTVRYLENNGYTVLTAAHPVEAEHLYAQHHDEIALLVTDIVMPAFNGRELYFRLIMRDPQLRVLFMSGYAEQALGEDSATLGEYFIQKPFTPTELLGRVRQLLDA